MDRAYENQEADVVPLLDALREAFIDSINEQGIELLSWMTENQLRHFAKQLSDLLVERATKFEKVALSDLADRLGDLLCASSISEVAKRQNVSRSTLSKMLKALKTKLGRLEKEVVLGIIEQMLDTIVAEDSDTPLRSAKNITPVIVAENRRRPECTAILPPVGEPPGDWRDQALCAEIDPELFFPKKDDPERRNNIETAKRLCGECAVRANCLASALENNEVHGIWGGLTGRERRNLIKARTA